MPKDQLQRFLFEHAAVRGETVQLSTSLQTILQQHQYPPLLQQLLSEALTAICLLSATIKFAGRLTLQFQGPGKLQLLLAQCTHQLDIRGLVQWHGELLSSEELWYELNKGTLAIIMDPDDRAGKRYQGIVDCVGQSLTQSLEVYFKQSEQLSTRLWIAVEGETAAGLLLQALPAESQSEDWQHFVTLTETLTPGELLALEPKELLPKLYATTEVRLFAPEPIQFKCNCSVARSEQAILLLGRKEAEEELKQKQQIVVTCEFCNKEYVFSRPEIELLFNSQGKPTTLH